MALIATTIPLMEIPASDPGSKRKLCGCPHHKVIPGLIVLTAIIILLGNFSVLSERVVNIAWPVILGLIGLQMMGENRCGCC